MSFLTWPIAAVAAGVLIPTLIILYFLKLRRRDVEVSSTLLWKKAIQDLQANAPFQKLRNNILLMLQLLILIVALLAIAQPEWRAMGAMGERQIIMIDRSASMSVVDAGDKKDGQEPSPDDARSRLDQAKAEAIKLVDSLKESTLLDDKAQEAMIIAFDSSAEVRQVFTSNKSLLKRAIEAIEPTQAPSGLQKAVDIARAYTVTRKFEDQIVEGGVDPSTGQRRAVGFIPSGPGAVLHIYSDGRLPDADRVMMAPEDRVQFHAVGKPDSPNIGITGLRAERSFDTPSRVNIFVGVQSTDPRPRTVDVELLVDGVTSRVSDVKIAPAKAGEGVQETGGSDLGDEKKPVLQRPTPGLGGFVFPLEKAEGGVAEIRLLPGDADALGADNTAFITIPPARRLNVALVTEGSMYVRRALDGLRLSRLDILTPTQFQAILDKGQTAQYDVMIFDKWLPMITVTQAAETLAAPTATPGTSTTPPAATPGAATTAPPKPAAPKRRPGLPPGRSLVLGAVPAPPLGANDLGKGDATVIYEYARDHPALRLSGLDKLNIAASRKVEIESGTPVRALARDSAGPAILEISDPTVAAIVVTFDVADSDWPFAAEWVMFLGGSVLYLSEVQVGALAEGVRAGETLSTRLPAGAESVEVRTPDGESIAKIPAADGTISHGPITRTGFYTIYWTGVATSTDAADGSRVTRRIAANLLDPVESDVGSSESLAIASDVLTAQPEREGNVLRKIWPWLLLGALGVMMLEWFIYNRKVAV